MRKLNKKEQSLVRLIVSSAQSNYYYHIGNILDPILNGQGNSIGIDLLQGELRFYEIAGKPTNLNNQLVSSIIEIEAQLIERVLLIKQLEENNLIYFLDVGPSGLDGNLFFRDSPYVSKPFDKDLIAVIRKSCDMPIVCMPELISMIEDDFVSEEEHRHNEEIKALRDQMQLSEKQHKELLNSQENNLLESNRRHKETLEQNEMFHRDEMITKNREVENSNNDARKSRRLAIIIAIASAAFSALASAAITKWVDTTINKDQIDSLVTRLTIPVDRIDSLAVQIIDNMEVRSSDDSLLFLIQDNVSKMRSEITIMRKNNGNSSVK